VSAMQLTNPSNSGKKAMRSIDSRTWYGRVARAVATIAVAAGVGVAAAPASAIEFDTLGASADNSAGDPVRQAGAHPDLRFSFSVPRMDPDDPMSGPVEQPHRILVDTPAGLVGDPTAMPTCPETMLKAGTSGNAARCPIGAQIGYARVASSPGDFPVSAAVFNVERPVGSPGVFAFNALGIVVKLTPSVRAGDFGVTIDSGTIANAAQFSEYEVNLWGVPADPVNDRLRIAPGGQVNCFPGFGCFTNGPPVASQSPRAPFLSLPTSCPGTPDVTTARLDGWRSSGEFATRSFSSDFDGVPFTMTGCEKLAFDPSVDVRPTSRRADSPTGLEFDLSVPQSEVANGLSTAHVKDVSVTLPEGMSVSPSAAGGLAACSDAQLDLSTTDPVKCPEASKIGSVEVETHLLEGPLSGAVYVGSQQSDDPMSGRMFRTFIVAEGSGVRVKLEGGVTADPQTGQLTATFKNNPQVPFSQLRARFFGGRDAALATPPTCGLKTVHVHMTSWSGKTVDRQSSFNVDCVPGLGGFSPSFTAGAVSPIAGAFSPFVVGVKKPDGQSAVDGLSIDMPKGVLAKIKGNLGTQVGSVTAFAGSGTTPFPLPGRVFLEGAYGDAPYSLRVVVPAKAGPFDLGEVVVRQKVYVDPMTAEVRVVSDPIPTIVKGVPTRLQRLDVNVDKPGFMVNPTSCEPKEVKATLRSAAGQTVALNTRFQVGACGDLAYSPKLTLGLTGRKQVTTGKHPGIRAKLRQASGQSATEKAKVTLPAALALDPDNAQALCEFKDGTKPDLEKHCPKGSIVGRARASTPLLERDLAGDVYFVKNVRKDARTGNEIRTLPMIVVALRGEIAINLRGEASTTKAGSLVNTFANLHDAPISKFSLNIQGGSNGILAVTRTRKAKINLCAKPNSHRAAVDLDGHNGKNADYATTVKTPCGAKAAKKAKKK
jgi:hypothetical protein